MSIKYTDMGWPELDALWVYHSLSDPLLSSELTRLSGAKSLANHTDYLSFQPCPNPEEQNQDRHIVQDWSLDNGIWKFCGIFDGHTGHDTVDYVLTTLPDIIKTALISAFNKSHVDTLSPDVVSDILSHSIQSLDNALTTDLLRLFPNPSFIDQLSDEEITATVNDIESGGVNSNIVARCMRGSTILVSLVDPSGSNLWVASLGDSLAVLGIQHRNGHWTASRLSSDHNGISPTEKAKIIAEHPGETGCIIDNRVLGALAVTRAIGDHLFKLPTIYTKRIFMAAQPGLSFTTKVEDFLGRNLTPPYISNRADVRHVDTGTLEATSLRLIMCSDGLVDLYMSKVHQVDELADVWVQLLAKKEVSDGNVNLALCLLRDALGGNDTERVSRMMTVEMCYRWMDDTTIIVQNL